MSKLKIKTNENKMYKLNLELVIRPEFLTEWCLIKGYQEKINSIDLYGKSEEIDNPETKEDFFIKLIKQELLNVAVYPIQNAIIQEANQIAQRQNEEIKQMAEESLKIDLVNS